MSVLGQNKDQGAAAIAPVMQQSPQTTGFFENVAAGFHQQVAGPHSTRNADAIYQNRTYDQIISALKAEGEQGVDYVESPVTVDSPFYHHVEGEKVNQNGVVSVPVKRDFRNPYVSGPSLTADINPLVGLYMGGDQGEKDQIWAAVQKVRQRKPDFLKAFSDQASFDRATIDQRQKDSAAAGQVTSRAGTMGTIGSFIGGVAGSVASLDPENAVGGVGGPAGKTIARTVLKRAASGAAANTAAATVALPGQVADAERLGEKMTTGDMVKSVAQAAAAGAVLGNVHTAPEIGSAIAGRVAEHLPATVRDPIVAASIRAGTVKDHDLLNEWRKLHNPYGVVDTSTPDERAAAHVVTRDAEVQESSPLQPSAVAHNETRLSALAQSLSADLPPPKLPTSAPLQTPTVHEQPATFSESIAHAEGSTRNPRSSADGYGNFIDKTWLAVAPKVTDTTGLNREQVLQLRHDKTIAARATDYYAAQNSRYLRVRGLEDSPGNLSLAHFLGPEGAAKVLKADPATPMESLLSAKVIEANHEVLRGKSADQVIAWAHKRIGAAVDHPPARPDAVADEGFDYSSPVPYTVETLKPEELPATSAGIPTDEPFNPNLSQHLLVWEANDGTRELIDGGKRLAHARAQADQNTVLPTVVLKESDGISRDMATMVGKLKNVNLGTMPLEEAAGTLADIPEIAAALRNPEFHREVAAISQLPYEDFGRVVNDNNDLPDAMNSLAFALKDKRPLSQIYEKGDVLSHDGRVGEVVSANDKNLVMDFDGDRQMIPRDDPLLQPATPEQWRVGGGVAKGVSHEKGVTTLERPDAAGGGPSEPPSGEGRDFAAQAPDENLLAGSQPSRDALERFSDPVGEAAKAQTQSLEHDLLMDAVNEAGPSLFDTPDTGFRVSDEGDAKPIHEIMQQAESDEAAAQALRECLQPPKVSE